MKDLALPDHLPALRAAGVSCFKVEGRKKSPLYVATTTDYYRKLLDGRLDAGERADQEADLQTVFSRPWTRLFIAVAQGQGSGRPRHRRPPRHARSAASRPCAATPIAAALPHRPRPGTPRRLADRPARPGQAVRLRGRSPVGRGRRPQGERARGVRGAGRCRWWKSACRRTIPPLPAGAPVYCSSSQAVKRRYRHDRPKPGLYRPRRAVEVEAVLTADELAVVGRVVPRRPEEPARGSPADAGRAVRAGAGRGRDGSGGAGRLRETGRHAAGTGVVRLAQRRRPVRAGVAAEPAAPRPGRRAGRSVARSVGGRACVALWPTFALRHRPRCGRRRSAGRSRWTASASWTPSRRRTGPASTN